MDRERDEPLYDYLERRERELTHQIAAQRSQLEQKEIELAHVQSARRQLGDLGGADKARFGVPPTAASLDLPPSTGLRSISLPDYQALTIKQLILQALGDYFSNGATPAQLRAFIKDAYGREIQRDSMAPQLSRLKDENLIEQILDGGKFKWMRRPRGLRGVSVGVP